MNNRVIPVPNGSDKGKNELDIDSSSSLIVGSPRKKFPSFLEFGRPNKDNATKKKSKDKKNKGNEKETDKEDELIFRMDL